MSTQALVELCEAGTFTTVRFRDDIADFSHRADDVMDELSRIVSDNNCLKLAIDLTGTRYLPSSALGVLVRLHNQGVEVHLVNASDAVGEVIRVTRLDSMLHVNELQLEHEEPAENSSAHECSHVALDGYYVACPKCEEELQLDKHELGHQTRCSQCNNLFTVTAEILREATHVSATCPDCGHSLRVPHAHLKQPLECRHCEAQLEVRTIA